MPELAELFTGMRSEDLIRFRIEDPISAAEVSGGLSLTGGHHRTHEVMRRIQAGQLECPSGIRVLVHD